MDESDLFRLLDAVAALVIMRFPGANPEIVSAASIVVVANTSAAPLEDVSFTETIELAEKAASAVIDGAKLLDDPTFRPLGQRTGVLAPISALCCADVANTSDEWFQMVDVMTQWPRLSKEHSDELAKFNDLTLSVWAHANV